MCLVFYLSKFLLYIQQSHWYSICFLIYIILYYNLIETKNVFYQSISLEDLWFVIFSSKPLRKYTRVILYESNSHLNGFLWYCTPQHVNVWNKKCIETLDANIPSHYGVYIYLMVVFKSTPPVWLVKSSFHFLSLLL